MMKVHIRIRGLLRIILRGYGLVCGFGDAGVEIVRTCLIQFINYRVNLIQMVPFSFS